jgi:hypothetical protein
MNRTDVLIDPVFTDSPPGAGEPAHPVTITANASAVAALLHRFFDLP